MKRFAFITNDGKINHILTTHIENEYVDGGTHLEYLVKDITYIDVSGKYWSGSGFVDLPECPGKYFNWTGSSWSFDREAALAEVIIERNNKLFVTDYTQVSDAPFTEEQKAEWRAYRQLLRDFPATLSNINSMDDIVWPTPPQN